MPNLGPTEIIVVLVIVLIVFGAGKLPDVLGQMGKGVRTFREEANAPEKPVASTATTTAEKPKTN